MAPRYAPSVRDRLPWLLLLLEVAFVLIFVFFVSFEPETDSYIVTYTAFQDINVMIFLGFGFHFAFLRRYGFSGVAFNLLIAAVGFQWAIIVDGLLFRYQDGFATVNIMSIVTASMSITPVLISAGALLGKASAVQLVCLTLFEVTAFTANRWIITEFLRHGLQYNAMTLNRASTLQRIDNHITMMYVYIFGAYFGLAIAWLHSHSILSNEIKREKEKSETMSDLFAMLGTLFLWMFFPTFNSMLVEHPAEKRNAVYNTYYALAVSAVTAFAMSAMTSEKGKLSMIHIRNAALAGGVTVSFSAYMINTPWIAMSLGLLAGMTSILGLRSIKPAGILFLSLIIARLINVEKTCLNSVFQIHDTSGIHATYGLPGLIGAIAHIVLLLTADWCNFTTYGYHALVEVGGICFTIFLSIGGGLITGILLKCRFWKAPQEWNYFDDQAYWEFPHLARKL